MSNYYTLFSEMLETTDPQEIAWLNAQFEEIAIDDRNDGLTIPRFVYEHMLPDEWDHNNDVQFEHRWQAEGLWLYSEDNCSLDQLVVLIQAYLAKFHPDKYWTCQYSGYCDKPRTDAYGGGAMFITATEIKEWGTGGWLEEQRLAFIKAQEKPACS